MLKYFYCHVIDLPCSAVLGVQHRDSDSFPYRLLQNIECSSSFFTVGPCLSCSFLTFIWNCHILMEQPFWKFTFQKCTGHAEFSCAIRPSDNLGSSYIVPSHLSDPVSPTHTHLWPREWFSPVGGADVVPVPGDADPSLPPWHPEALHGAHGLLCPTDGGESTSLSSAHITPSSITVHSQTDISVKHPSDTAPQNNAVNPRDTHITH